MDIHTAQERTGLDIYTHRQEHFFDTLTQTLTIRSEPPATWWTERCSSSGPPLSSGLAPLGWALGSPHPLPGHTPCRTHTLLKMGFEMWVPSSCVLKCLSMDKRQCVCLYLCVKLEGGCECVCVCACVRGGWVGVAGGVFRCVGCVGLGGRVGGW